MVFYISVLRAIAACFITNSHYTGIYPIELLANGGLIGDVLFFAVSGYCLYNVKYDLSVRGFAKWYGKRIWRIYPPVIITTAVYMLLGKYNLAKHGFVWWYIFPTYYQFIASIMVLYIPYFFIMRIRKLRESIIYIMVGIAAVWLIVFFTAFDRTYYHIDDVYGQMIYFLFMESMLLGAWFRQNDKGLRNKFSAIYLIITLVAFGIYFASKILFSQREELAHLQFLNQVAIFVFLLFFFRTICSLDGMMEKMPMAVKKIIVLISEMTLEIYIVQFVIIDEIRNLNLFFPLNCILLTASILIAAFILHKICGFMYGIVEKKLKERKA